MWTENNGFSFIELMVVISIIAVVAVIALPRFALYKINAAQVEKSVMINNLHTLAQAYRAENDTFVVPISMSLSTGYGDSSVGGASCLDSTVKKYLGFSSTTCERLRYVYIYTPTDQNRFTIRAQSMWLKHSFAGAPIARMGNKNGPPTQHCKSPSQVDFPIYYQDIWENNQDNNTFAQIDAKLECFK